MRAASSGNRARGRSGDLPAIDIAIEENKVREYCLERFPDREELYEMIYESRFQRLWDQFRCDEDDEQDNADSQ